MLQKPGSLKFSGKADFLINLWWLRLSFLAKLQRGELKQSGEHAFWSLDYNKIQITNLYLLNNI